MSEPLRVVAEASTRPIIAAPPALTLTKNGTEYLCGYCRTLLLIAKAGDLRDGIMFCKVCGRYNEQVPTTFR
jgi:hypothetical protein